MDRREFLRTALLVMVFVGAACGSDGGTRVTTASTTTLAAPAPATAKFCTGWKGAMTAQDEARAMAVLRDAPPDLAEAATVLRSSKSGDDANADAETAAIDKVTRWVEVNCDTDSAQRHVAPPADARLPGLTLCSAGAAPQLPPPERTDEKVVLYGETGRGDAYDGPMIGVFTAKAGEGDYRGDGDATAVTVRGQAGSAAPITVFQQVILPELGTVITWTEAGHDVGLFGRLWTKDQTKELVALADRLELVDGRFEFPAGARPDGYDEVFAGSPDANWSIVASAISGDYQVRYQGAGASAIVTLAGLQLTAEQFDTFRFFGLPIARARIGDHDALFGGLWSETNGPFVATWREPDGFTVRISGIGASREQVRAVAEQSQELNRSAWVKLVESAEDCESAGPG